MRDIKKYKTFFIPATNYKLPATKFKNLLLTILIFSQYFIPIFGTTYTNAQTQPLSWQWAVSGGSPTSVSNSVREQVTDMAVDKVGNVYVTGYTFENSKFDSIHHLGYGSHDVFVAKYNCTGQREWIKFNGGTALDGPGGLVIDDDGGVYVSGRIRPSNANVTIFDSILNQSSRIYLAKLDAQGNRKWLFTSGFGTIAIALCLDKEKNTYSLARGAAGQYAPGYNLTTAFYLAKHDSLGAIKWVKDLLNPTPLVPRGIGTDESGNIYVGGTFQDSVTIGTTKLYAPLGSGSFISKFDPNGDFIWAKYEHAIMEDFKIGLNYLYITGTTAFDNVYGQDTIKCLNNTGCGYIAKFDTSGNALWGKWVDSQAGSYSLGLGFNQKKSEVFMTGWAAGWAKYGNLTLNPQSGSLAPSFARYDFAGSLLQAELINGSGSGSDGAYCAGADGFGNVYIAGKFGGKIYLGNNDSIHSDSYSTDMFIAKFGTSDCVACYVGDTLFAEACAGDSVMVNNTWYSAAGFFPTDTLSHFSSCDTVKLLAVNMLPNHNIQNNLEICTGDSAMVFGSWQKTPGQYHNYLSTAKGCDSTLVIGLSLKPLPQVSISGNLYYCTGESTSLTAGGANTYQWQSGQNGSSIVANAPGVYAVTGTATNLCKGIASATVSEYPLLNPTFTQSGNTLTASLAPAYQWHKDGLPLPNETQQSLVLSASGNYKVKTTSTDHCEEFSGEEWISVTGVNETENGKLLMLYPNPTSGTAMLEYSLGTQINFIVYDMHGRKVKEIRPETSSGKIDLEMASSPPGVYLIAAYSDNGLVEVKRLVKLK